MNRLTATDGIYDAGPAEHLPSQLILISVVLLYKILRENPTNKTAQPGYPPGVTMSASTANIS